MAEQYIIVDINTGQVKKFDLIEDAEADIDLLLEKGNRKNHLKIFYGHQLDLGTVKIIDPTA